MKIYYKKENNSHKIRNSNVEFIRILSMFSIIIHHILVHGKIIRKYNKFRELNLLKIFCNWHVSTFALISGIVGYRSNKYSNLLYLYLCTLFYSKNIYLLFKLYKPNLIKNQQLFYYFFPVIFQKYWYFTSYFGMYLFLPIVNSGVSILSSNELNIFIISTLGIFIIWKDFMNFKNDPFKMNSGGSTLWLLVFYIIGAYFGKYKLRIYKKKFYIFLICFIIFIGSTLLCYYLSYFNDKGSNLKIIIKLKQLYCFRINSLSMVSQSISLTFFFSQFKYNKILSKIINFFGSLTFGIYLIHDHELIRKYIIGNLFLKDSFILSKKSIILLILLRGFSIFFICSIIDYLRYLVFFFLKIKKICILLEIKVKQLFL